MHFFTFIFKNLLRRPARSLLTIVGLGVAVGAVVALVGVADGFEASFLDAYGSRDLDLVVNRAGGSVNQVNNGLPDSLEPLLAALPGVKLVAGGLVDGISFEKEGIFTAIINGWAPHCPLFDTLIYLKGRRLQAGDLHKVIVGRVLAGNLGKTLGDTIEIYSKPFEIVGIYESKIVYENGGVIILLEEMQRLTDRPGEVAGFTIQADPELKLNEKGMEELRQRIENLLPGTIQAKPAADFVQSVQEIRVSRAVAWLTSAIALVIGAIGMLNTMIMSVFERTKEIGTLRAIGWRKSRIIHMVLGESVLLSLAGAIVGSVGGVALVRVLCHLPNTANLVAGSVAWPVLAQGFIVAFGVGILGALYPAFWSANLMPTEALRR